MYELCVSPVTVKVASAPVFMVLLSTLHWPVASLMHPPDPVTLPLHSPVTDTASTG